MKKTILILAVLAFLTTACNQATKKQSEYGNIPSDSIQVINETCLVLKCPEEQHFDDENSEEAQNYFTVLDDFVFYSSTINSCFGKLDIHFIKVEKRYLSFALNNGKNHIIDTKEQSIWEAFLYKKGEKPISVDVFNSDWKAVAEYLQMEESEIRKRIELNDEDEEQTQRIVKHHYSAYSNDFDGDVNYVFFDDGTLYECFGCQLDISTQKILPNRTYKEFASSLLVEKCDVSEHFVDLLDDNGRIPDGWQIINYHKVLSPYQIIDFMLDTAKIHAGKIQKIKGPVLIFPQYEEKFWTDKGPDVQAEWAHRKAQKIGRLHEMNFQNYLTAEKRYLSFVLADGEKIIVDIKKFGEERFWEVLLYIEGYLPFRLHLMDFDDKREHEIEMMLRRLEW